MVPWAVVYFLVLLPTAFAQSGNNINTTNTSMSTAAGVGLSQTVAGQPATFTIHAKDQFGVDRAVSEAEDEISFFFHIEIVFSAEESSQVLVNSVRTIKEMGCLYTGLYYGYTSPYISLQESGIPSVAQIVTGEQYCEGGKGHPQVARTECNRSSCCEFNSASDINSTNHKCQSKIGANECTDIHDDTIMDFSVNNGITNCDLGDGTYNITYVATVAGKYNIVIRRGDPLEHISGSPFAMNVFPSSIASGSITVDGVGQVAAGESAAFQIIAHDRWSNGVTVDELSIGVRGPIFPNPDPPYQMLGTSLNNTLANDIVGDGIYRVVYEPTRNGIYTIKIALDGNPIAHSPFFSSVISAATHGPSCTSIQTSTQLIRETIAGESSSFIVQANDRFGNRREGGYEASMFEVQLVGAHFLPFKVFTPIGLQDCFTHAPKATICDMKDGQYLVRYVPVTAGTYNISLKYAGEYFRGSPVHSLVTYPGAPFHDKCIAFGDGLHRGVLRKPATFIIQARDIFANNVTSNASEFVVLIKRNEDNSSIFTCNGRCRLSLKCSRSRQCVAIQYSNSGLYAATWWPTHVGEYSIQVQLRANNSMGGHIIGSESQALVGARKTHGPATFVSGSGLLGGIAGRKIQFFIHAKDEENYNQSVGGDIFEVTLVLSQQNHSLRSGITEGFEILDLHTGVYSVSYACTVSGAYNMYVLLKSTAIIDAHGDASVSIGNGFPCANALDNRTAENGFDYDCTRPPDCSDENKCPILHRDTQHNPFPVAIKPAEYFADACLVHGRGLTQAVAGQLTNFTIQPRDEYSNNATFDAYQIFTVSILSRDDQTRVMPDARVMAASKSDGSSAVYIVDYTIETAGHYAFSISLRHTHTGSDSSNSSNSSGNTSDNGSDNNNSSSRRYTRDMHFEVIPDNGFARASAVLMSAGNSEVEVDIALLNGTGVLAGTDVFFTLASYDRYNNLRKHGGDTTVAELRKLSGDSITSVLIIIPCEVTDMQTGEYMIAFSAIQSGTYSVLVTLNGDKIREAPFDAVVVAAERSPAKCIAEGAGLVGGQHAKDLAVLVISKGIDAR
jgi:hypothetical protein